MIREDLLRLVPGLNPVGLLGGTYSPEDGNCSPLLALHAYYVHAVKAGAVFHYNEPVRGLLVQGGKIHGVKTDHGRICRGGCDQRLPAPGRARSG